MIFDAQRYSLVMWDFLYSMGAGFVVGAIHQLLSVFLYRSKAAVFIKDLVCGGVFATVVFSYVVSFANYKVLRWYNIAGALMGRLLFTPGFAQPFHRLIAVVQSPVKNTVKNSFEYFRGKLLTKMQKKVENFHENIQKNQPEVLKQTEIVLYN